MILAWASPFKKVYTVIFLRKFRTFWKNGLEIAAKLIE